MPVPISKQRTKVGQDIASLGKLVFLYDANDLVSDYANGDSVTNWLDKSGNGFHVAQSGAARPTLVTNADGFGNACTRWAGAQYMTATARAFAQPLTVFSVSKVTSLTTPGTVRPFLASGPNFEVFFYNQVGTPVAGMFGGSADLMHSTIAVNVTYIRLDIFNGTSSTGFIDGVQGTTGNVGTSGTSTTITVGRYETTPYFIGDIYLVGCFQGAINANTRLTLNRILSERFQLSITQ
jgi:hypothetical protein